MLLDTFILKYVQDNGKFAMLSGIRKRKLYFLSLVFIFFFLSAPSVNKTVYSGKIDSVSITVNIGNIANEKVNTRTDLKVIPVTHNASRFSLAM